jgi:hypothetical protein
MFVRLAAFRLLLRCATRYRMKGNPRKAFTNPMISTMVIFTSSLSEPAADAKRCSAEAVAPLL